MTQPEREDFLTTNGVADALGVSTMRIRQMITEGKLPEPTNLGTRFYVWHRADIEAVKGALAGGGLSPPSAMLSPPGTPLSRVRDEVLTVVTGWERNARPVHVRVWHGPAPEGPRTVVLLGEMLDGAHVRVHLETIVREVAPLLPAPVAQTVWFDYRPGEKYPPHEVNQRMWREPDTPEHTATTGGRVRHLFGRAGRPGPLVHRVGVGGLRRWADAAPKLSRPATLAEVGRVVGSEVEAYPPQAYTQETIEAWRRSGRCVAVRHDVVNYDSLMNAAHTLNTVREHTTDPARAGVLDSAIHLLVDDVRDRLAYIATRGWEDGTTPIPGVKKGPTWPTLWAARLENLEPTPDDEALFAAWPDNFVIGRDICTHAPLHTLLGALRAWSRQVDPYAEHPDGALHTALERAGSLLAFYLGVYDRAFRDSDHPDTEVRVHEARGAWDRGYLDQLSPVPVGADPEHARSERVLSERLRPLLQRPHVAALAGLDSSGRLVLHYPDEGRDGTTLYAVEWPLRPPPHPIPAGTRIVADNHPSDRPVYLAYPGGHLDLLPAPPGMRDRGWGWGWGYDGSDPGALGEAIISTFTRADDLSRDQVPRAWIRDQLVYAHPDQPLDIAVDELRRRYSTPTSAHADHDRWTQ